MQVQAIEIGALIIRVTLGIVLLAHSVYLKAVVFTLPGTATYFASIGLPPLAAYGVFTVEVIGGVALLAGFAVRVAALAVVPVLLGATWAHLANGWLFSNGGGGWEYPLVLTALAVAQVFLGPGVFALQARRDKTAQPHGSRQAAF